MIGYQYGADGNRVGKGTVTTIATCDITANGYTPIADYVLDQGGDQMTEMAIATTASGTTSTWVHSNVSAAGALIATYDNTGYGLHFYLNDALGSRRVQTDATGVPEQSCQSLPFGDQLFCTGSLTSPTEHHFTGKERDTESGLDYFGARYYASNMGRFMSADWSAKEEPVPYAKLDNPQSLNLYGYVSNNPLSRVDPDGHQQEEDAEGEAEGAAARNARNGLRPMTLEEAEAAARLHRPLTPAQRAFNDRYILGSGGRWGSNQTRNQNSSLADVFADAGYKVLGGAYDKEEFIKGSGPGNKGGTFVDLTVTDGKQVIRIQAVDLTSEGKLTDAEAAAAARIRAKYPNDKLFSIAKTPYRRPASPDPVVPPVKVK